MQQTNLSKTAQVLSLFEKRKNPDIDKELGANVKRLRKERSWSQVELGEKSGIHRNHIGAIENGTGNPTINVVAKLAALFGIKPATLLVPYVRKRTRPSIPAKPREE